MHSIPDPLFRKSSYTTSNNCVEVADLPGTSAVRDTKHRDAGHIEFPASEWQALLDSVKSNEL